MKLPLAWLRDFVAIQSSPAILAEKLTLHGLEVEEVIDRRHDFDRVVVGEVLKIKRHPQSEKLLLATVKVHPTRMPIEIVCGAPNVAVGQKVAVALVGAKLSGGLVIASRTIRGVSSHGMICSEKELGLGSDQSGILILENSLAIGTPLAQPLGFDDVIFDLSIPSNRSDLFSVRGLAREIAAILKLRFSEPSVHLKKSRTITYPKLRVEVLDQKACPVYTARIIRGVQVKPSPLWMQQRLRAAGLRPINAVVDCTNYILLAYGQPLHAFDAATIADATILVRPANNGEKLTTLDGQERSLQSSMLTIADRQRPVALAGIMGGRNTEISATTRDVILEAAIFDPVSVRRTSRRLGLQTDSSLRFEKGLPIALPEEASDAATGLMIEICGGTAEGRKVRAGKRATTSTTISFRPTLVSEVLGQPVKTTETKAILTRLGFHARGAQRQWRVTVPAFRLDVAYPEDLVDEVGRLMGYDDLPESLPPVTTAPMALPWSMLLKERLRDLLAGFGFMEVINHPFYGETEKLEVGGPHVLIANPLDQSQTYLRRSLVPDMKKILANLADAGDDGKIFEIGRIFTSASDRDVTNKQPWQVAIGLCARPEESRMDYRKITGVFDALAESFGAEKKLPLEVGSQNQKGRVLAWGAVELSKLASAELPKKYQPSPLLPAVERDLSFWSALTVRFADLEKEILASGKPLLASMYLLDALERGQQRSLTIRLNFRLPNRTLSSEEVEKSLANITQRLQDRFHIQPR